MIIRRKVCSDRAKVLTTRMWDVTKKPVRCRARSRIVILPKRRRESSNDRRKSTREKAWTVCSRSLPHSSHERPAAERLRTREEERGGRRQAGGKGRSWLPFGRREQIRLIMLA